MHDLKNLGIVISDIQSIFLVEFFMSGRFLIEVKYWKKNFNNLNKTKQTNNNKKTKKNNKPSFWNKLYLSFTVFSY